MLKVVESVWRRWPVGKGHMVAEKLDSYEAGSIRFAFPADWAVEETRAEEGTSVTAQSNAVTFAIIGVYSDQLNPGDLVDQAVESLREEHRDLEVEETDETEWDDGAAAEALFFSLDFLTYCWIRSGRIGPSTFFVFLQTVEPELEIGRAALEAICRSAVPLADPHLD